MQARVRFMLGAGAVVATVGTLMAFGIKDTGVYFLVPSELAERAALDSTVYNVGLRIGGDVVPGSIQRDVATQTITFEVADAGARFPVTYRGLAPDTFTDSVQVVVEGRLHTDGVLHATNVLAKCGSKYEALPPTQPTT